VTKPSATLESVLGIVAGSQVTELLGQWLKTAHLRGTADDLAKVRISVGGYDVVLDLSGRDLEQVSRDLLRAMALVPTVLEIQADEADRTREELVEALMRHRVALTPSATLMAAQRLATQRDGLLATGAFSYDTLAALRRDRQVSSTRTWVARKRRDRAMFTLNRGQQTLIPAFQLSEAGDARPELRPLLGTLLDAGIDGWQLWTWLTSASSLLSGEIPHEVARRDPLRAERAAQRFAQSTAA
jgi:hypothetical protein